MMYKKQNGTAPKVTPEQALIKLEEACARAERSSGEVREKLWKWGITGSVAESIIDRLIDGRFVDDARFARAFVYDKVKFAFWGRRKISAALYAKRIPSSLIREALDTIDEDLYRANFDHIILRKAASLGDLTSRQDVSKLLRFALSRGYEPDMVYEAIQNLDLDTDL